MLSYIPVIGPLAGYSSGCSRLEENKSFELQRLKKARAKIESGGKIREGKFVPYSEEKLEGLQKAASFAEKMIEEIGSEQQRLKIETAINAAAPIVSTLAYSFSPIAGVGVYGLTEAASKINNFMHDSEGKKKSFLNLIGEAAFDSAVAMGKTGLQDLAYVGAVNLARSSLLV